MGGRGHVVKKHLRYPHPIPPKFRTMFFFPFPTLLFACSPKKKNIFYFLLSPPSKKNPIHHSPHQGFIKPKKKSAANRCILDFLHFPPVVFFFSPPPIVKKIATLIFICFFLTPPPKKNHINWRTGRKLFSKKKKNKNSKQAIPLFFLNPISFHLPLSCTQIPKQNSTKNKQHNTKTNKTNQHKSNSETAPILFLFSLHW